MPSASASPRGPRGAACRASTIVESKYAVARDKRAAAASLITGFDRTEPSSATRAKRLAVAKRENRRTTSIDTLYPLRDTRLPRLPTSDVSSCHATSNARGIRVPAFHLDYTRRSGAATPTPSRAATAVDGVPYAIDDRSAGGPRRQRKRLDRTRHGHDGRRTPPLPSAGSRSNAGARRHTCLLYTSDAADERSSVDLGGR